MTSRKRVAAGKRRTRQEMPVGERRLRDRVGKGVRVLFVGINPGMRSAATGHHFAGYSNRFWKLLHESGLVPEAIAFVDDSRLVEWGYGITNLIARPSPGIADLKPEEYVAGRRKLLAKVARWRPEVVALVGVTLYRSLFPEARDTAKGTQRRGALEPGLRPQLLEGARLFVLPNPSGRNANYSYAEMLAAFRALKTHLDAKPPPG